MDSNRVADPPGEDRSDGPGVDRLAARPVRELAPGCSTGRSSRQGETPPDSRSELLAAIRGPASPPRRTGSVPEGVGARHLGRSRPPMLLAPHQIKLRLGASPRPRRAATRRCSSSQALSQLRNSSETAIGGIRWGSGEPMRAVAEGSLLRVGRGRLEATGMASPGRRARVSGLYPCSGPCKG
jgi:hypothetical protein